MEFIDTSWLLVLGGAAAWTIFFSMFSAPGVRGWRNLGWVACFVLGAVMLVVLPWRAALSTWAAAGIFSGLLYFAYELFIFIRLTDKTEMEKPNPVTIIHGLALWPIMLPEVVEYFLAEVGVLKAPK